MKIEQIKKDIEKLDTKDLFGIIIREALLSGEVSIKGYTKKNNIKRKKF